jgi:hypothetical protein
MIVIAMPATTWFPRREPEPGRARDRRNRRRGKGRAEHFSLEAQIDHAGPFRVHARHRREQQRRRHPNGGRQQQDDERVRFHV